MMTHKREGRGKITKINELFEVYRMRLVAPQGSVIKTFIEIVGDLYNISIQETQCSYSVHTKTLSLRVSGTIKTELALHKIEILDHLKGRIGAKGAPRDIR